MVSELKYYDFSTDQQVTCGHCGWSGRAGDGQSVEADRLEVRCISCGALVLVVLFPNLEDARAAAAAGNPQAVADLPGFEDQQEQREEAFERVGSFWKRPNVVDYYDHSQGVVPAAAQALAELSESEQTDALEVVARAVIAHVERLDLDDQGVVALACSVVDDFYKTVATTLTWPPESSRYVEATFGVIMDWVTRRGFTLRYIVDSSWPDGLDRPIVHFPHLMAFANLGYICPHQLAWTMAQSDGALPSDRTPTLEELSRWIDEGRDIADQAVQRFADAHRHIVFMEADWVEGCLDGVMGSTEPGTIEIFRNEAPTPGSTIKVTVVPRSAG